jgi:hypothetical protein
LSVLLVDVSESVLEVLEVLVKLLSVSTESADDGVDEDTYWSFSDVELYVDRYEDREKKRMSRLQKLLSPRGESGAWHGGASLSDSLPEKFKHVTWRGV